MPESLVYRLQKPRDKITAGPAVCGTRVSGRSAWRAFEGMDIALAKINAERRKARTGEPSYLRGNPKGMAPSPATYRYVYNEFLTEDLSRQDSVMSIGGVTSIPKSQRLPQIQRGGRHKDGAQTARERSGGAGTGAGGHHRGAAGESMNVARDGFATRPPTDARDGSLSVRSRRSHRSAGGGLGLNPISRQPSVNPPGELAMPAQSSQFDGRQYYTLRVRPLTIVYVRGEDEEHEPDPALQLSVSIDGMMSQTKTARKEIGSDEIQLPKESFIFQPEGSPVGTLMMIKLIGIRPRTAPQELGTALMDLSTVPIGGRPIELTSTLSSSEPGRTMSVTLSVKVYLRRKSFTFSYLNAEPIFRRSGYAVTAQGLQSFPIPFKKKGMPVGTSFFSLRYTEKLSEEVAGHEVWRAVDKAGNRYTVKKFLIMDTACRVLFTSELDGLLDCEPGQGVELCDAFLDGVRLSIVIDDMGGIQLREALEERGAAPEMVTSIVLRQVLRTVAAMHENKSRLHNDIDARNILICKTGEVRLGGFSYSYRHVGRQSKFAGPYLHMAPERLLGLECSFPADIWSIGMLALELALGNRWHREIDFNLPNALFEFKNNVVAEPSPTLRGTKGASDELRHFVDQCLHKNVRARPTPSALLNHPFIEKYESFTLPAGTWVCKKAKEAESTMAAFSMGTAGGKKTAAAQAAQAQSMRRPSESTGAANGGGGGAAGGGTSVLQRRASNVASPPRDK